MTTPTTKCLICHGPLRTPPERRARVCIKCAK